MNANAVLAISYKSVVISRHCVPESYQVHLEGIQDPRWFTLVVLNVSCLVHCAVGHGNYISSFHYIIKC